jgi:2-acylglycerol O-acyltransferase 2
MNETAIFCLRPASSEAFDHHDDPSGIFNHLPPKMGLRFAPLNLPLERRLQTLATLITQSLFFMILLINLYMLLNPMCYPLVLSYVIFMYFDKSPGNFGIGVFVETLTSALFRKGWSSY